MATNTYTVLKKGTNEVVALFTAVSRQQAIGAHIGELFDARIATFEDGMTAAKAGIDVRDASQTAQNGAGGADAG